MAEQKTAEPSEGKGIQRKQEPEAPPEPRYNLDEAKARARALTGRSPHIVAGALAGSDKETHTASQIEQAVNEYVKRPEAAEED